MLLECINYDHYGAFFRSQPAVLDSRPFTLEQSLGLWNNRTLQSRALVAFDNFVRDAGTLTTYLFTYLRRNGQGSSAING